MTEKVLVVAVVTLVVVVALYYKIMDKLLGDIARLEKGAKEHKDKIGVAMTRLEVLFNKQEETLNYVDDVADKADLKVTAKNSGGIGFKRVVSKKSEKDKKIDELNREIARIEEEE